MKITTMLAALFVPSCLCGPFGPSPSASLRAGKLGPYVVPSCLRGVPSCLRAFVAPRLRGAAAAGLAALTLVACGRGEEPAAARPAPAAETRPAAAPPRVPEVTVAKPTRDAVRADAEVPGTFVAFDETTISAEGAGPIRAITVDEGSRVAKGDVLIQQDTTKAELAVRQAEAMLAQSRANFARAKADLERKQQLLTDKTIPQNQFDSFKAAADAAAAAIDSAETSLAIARQQLKDLTIVAPYTGVIRERRESLGAYVRGGDALLVLMRVDPLKLQFEVPEKYATRIAAGLQVSATLTAFPGQEFTGRVRTVFPAVAVQSRAVKVEATVPNARYLLKPGFFASVRVPLTSVGRSLAVPRSALVRHEGTENVFVVRGDRAELVRVQTGAETAELIEIVTGLTDADNVVVAGGETLQAGDRVKVRS
jgi:membrane fusion protein (multidrug efflux system)